MILSSPPIYKGCIIIWGSDEEVHFWRNLNLFWKVEPKHFCFILVGVARHFFFWLWIRPWQFQGSTGNVKEAYFSLGGLRESWEVVVLGKEEVDCQKGSIYLVDIAQWIQFQTHVRRMLTCIYLGAGGASCFYKCRFRGQWQLVCVHIFKALGTN